MWAASSRGPLAPPGTYQVNASYRTNVERRTVAVGAGTLSTVELHWPNE